MQKNRNLRTKHAQNYSVYYDKPIVINPQAPVAQKIAVFRRFQGQGVEFFEIGPHLPPSDF